MTNPLLADWDTPHQMPPFALIQDAHFAPALEAALQKARMRIAAIASEISLNAGLFARIETLWRDRESLELAPEQARLLFVTRRAFLRAGARLQGSDRDRLAAIMQRLATPRPCHPRPASRSAAPGCWRIWAR